MTGGQDRAAAVRRIALAAAVRSDRISEFMGSTATPRLKAGALQPAPRRFPPSGIPAALRPGSLIPNPLVSAANGKRARLDTILAGRAAVLTARPPDASLEKFCRRHGLALVQITSTPRTGPPAPPDAGQHADWIDLRLAGDAPPAGIPGLGRRSGADRHREPRPRNRRGGVPVPAAPPALVRSGQCRGRVSGTGSLARPLRARRPGADRPLGGRRFPTHLDPSRWPPAPRGRQADRPAEDTAVRRALRILWVRYRFIGATEVRVIWPLRGSASPCQDCRLPSPAGPG